jgi:aryl-alcohol dehydrogenase-like predicted oxidoreductase
MRYVRLGKSELEVSAIAFGTWSFGGEWGAFDRAEATKTIEGALDLGITLFDTAQGYGSGAAERVLGDALWGVGRREDVIVATKGGLRPEGDGLVRDAGSSWLRSGVESSLRTLRTEYIDLYQVHWPDPNTPAEETGSALGDLVRQGKIRHVGVSNYDVKQVDDLAGYLSVETLQSPYHMFRRDIEAEILPYAQEQDIGVLAYGPLAHGLLSGAMTPTTSFAGDDWRSHNSDFTGEAFRRNLLVVDRLKRFAQEHGTTLPQLAVAWTLSHPAVEVAIIGARSPSHLGETAAAADITLSEDDRREIDRILADAAPVVGPSPEGM